MEWKIFKGWHYDTCLSQSHRTCWGLSADPLQSGNALGHSTGQPVPQRSGSFQQHRPASWTRWAVTAGTNAGNCRTTAEGSGGSWRIRTINTWDCFLGHIVLLFLVKTAVMWPGVCGNYDSPVLLCLCSCMSKFICLLICEELLTVPKTSGALSSAQWSVGHCSGWRRGSLGAALVAVPCKRHKYTVKMTETIVQIAFNMKT